MNTLPLRLYLQLALRALTRNRLQTALAMLGMTVGVGAVVTSMALGQGAQLAINDQLRAAGANVILVTAGNYKIKGEDTGGGVVEHQSARAEPRHGRPRFVLRFAALTSDHTRDRDRDRDRDRESEPRIVLAMHPEDDPMAIHNHPTAKQRLGDAMAGLGAAATLTRDDAEAIRREVKGVQLVAAGVHENARVSVPGTADAAGAGGGATAAAAGGAGAASGGVVGARGDRASAGSASGAGKGSGTGDRTWFTRLHGTDMELPEIRRGWTFPRGRFFSRGQVAAAAQVMVLGRVAADRLFGDGVNPVGHDVRLWNQSFNVIGVVASKSWAVQPVVGDDQFDAVYVPFTTVHRLLNLTKLNTITVTAASVGDTSRVARDVTALLRKRHRIGEAAADDFTVSTQAQQALGRGLPPTLARVVTGNLGDVEQVTIDQLSRALRRANYTMVGLLASVAAVSLLVGGIGIMNLLLLSVTERTREIGLRVALGARRRDVLMQFVSEAVVLSVAGGLLGIVCGAIASGGLAQIFRWAAVLSPGSMLLAMGVSALVGLAFGVYPARRAAQLDPIEALRHE